MLIVTNQIWGQSFSCGTPSPSFTELVSNSADASATTATFSCATVKIYFQFIRKSNGTGGRSHTEIPQLVANLNAAYNSINITVGRALQSWPVVGSGAVHEQAVEIAPSATGSVLVVLEGEGRWESRWVILLR